MQEGPRVEKCPIAIQFVGTYVIVMGVSSKCHSKFDQSILALKLVWPTTDVEVSGENY